MATVSVQRQRTAGRRRTAGLGCSIRARTRHIKHVALHASCEKSREAIPCSLGSLHTRGPSKHAQGKGSVRPGPRLKLQSGQCGQGHCLYYYLPYIIVFRIQWCYCTWYLTFTSNSSLQITHKWRLLVVFLVYNFARPMGSPLWVAEGRPRQRGVY